VYNMPNRSNTVNTYRHRIFSAGFKVENPAILRRRLRQPQPAYAPPLYAPQPAYVAPAVDPDQQHSRARTRREEA